MSPARVEKRKPLLLNMPAPAAWLLAFPTGLALLWGLLIIFAGGSLDAPAYLAALLLPVGLTPLIARWKGMSVPRWTIGSVLLSIAQVAFPIIILHPITALLAVLFHRPPQEPSESPEPSRPPPQRPASAPTKQEAEAQPQPPSQAPAAKLPAPRERRTRSPRGGNARFPRRRRR